MTLRPAKIRSTTTVLASALSLLALTACPDDPGEDGTDGSSEDSTTGETTNGPTTNGPTTADTTVADTTVADTTEGETEATTATTGEQATLLERIIEAIGGQAALEGLEQVQLEGSGQRFVPYESYLPTDDAVLASDFTTVTSVDFANQGLRNDIERNPLFIPTPMPFNISEIVSGDVGYVDGLESIFGMPPATDMLSDRWASTVKQHRLLNPHHMLKDLLVDAGPAVEGGTADLDGVEHELLVVDDLISPVTLWVDPSTNLISRLTTMENAHLHRDTEIDVRYLDWQPTGDGVLFPMQVQLWYGGHLIHDEVRSTVTSNPGLDAATFELPPESTATFDAVEAERGARNHQHNQLFTSIGIPLDGLQTFVAADEVEPGSGVWFLGGGSHHSMVIEQAGGVVVLDAPLHKQRCEAMLDWIDTNLSMPVTHIVVSHHHEDHVACARTMVAAGATLVVHESSQTFFEEILAAPSTIEPDLLEEMPVGMPPIEVIPAGGSFTLDDMANPITIYELSSTHAADLVLPFVESVGAAFTVDIFSPGFPANPFGAQEVLDAFDAAGITMNVSWVIGGHGFGYASLGDVQTAAGM